MSPSMRLCLNGHPLRDRLAEMPHFGPDHQFCRKMIDGERISVSVLISLRTHPRRMWATYMAL